MRIEIYRDEETEVDRTIGESVFKIWRERDQDVKRSWNGEGGESKKSRDNGDQRWKNKGKDLKSGYEGMKMIEGSL